MGGIRLAAGEPKEAILEWRVLRHRNGRGEDANGAPLLRVRRDDVPEALHQLVWQRRIDADDLGDVVRPQAAETAHLPEVLPRGVVTKGAVDHAVEVRQIAGCCTGFF